MLTGMVSGPYPEHPSEPSHLGYIWTVYARDSNQPMIANGHSSTEQKARAQVEAVLAGEPDHSAYGLVISAYGTHDLCRRSYNGDHAFTWRPLWPDATA